MPKITQENKDKLKRPLRLSFLILQFSKHCKQCFLIFSDIQKVPISPLLLNYCFVLKSCSKIERTSCPYTYLGILNASLAISVTFQKFCLSNNFVNSGSPQLKIAPSGIWTHISSMNSCYVNTLKSKVIMLHKSLNGH